MKVSKKNVSLRDQTWVNDKRRRGKRSKDNRSQQVQDHIPLDLTLEILSRLPAKSILRYQCVSKLWSSFITLPSFINSFASQSSSRSPSLLLIFSSDQRRFVFSFPQHQKSPDGSKNYSPFYYYEIAKTDCCNPLSESVQGLILLPGFKIWNPTLKRFLALPYPNEHIRSGNWCWESYLGYDPLEGKHKVLCVSPKEQPRVLTLGAQESWRIITKGCPMHRPTGLRGICFNGVMYYSATVDDDQPIIMSFDVKSENFNPIKYPQSLSPLRLRMQTQMIPFEGRLALFKRYFPLHDDFDFYILKDGDGIEWTHQRFHAPRKKRMDVILAGITDAGELMFVPSVFSDAFYFIYLDPRRNSTREALFEGTMGEFRRRYELASNNTYTPISVFPNHIESLKSL